MTQRHECGGTYIGVSECTRREEYDGIGGGSKWGVSIYDGVGSPPAIVLVDEHGEKGNDVLSLIVRNLSIDECLFNKGTIVQRMDNQMSSFSAKPGLDQKTNRTNGTVEDPKMIL